MHLIQRELPDANLPEDLHPVLRRLYASRGVRSENDLNLQVDQLLPYDQLKNIDQAAGLLAEALQKKQRILIVGDYDADGATSCAVAIRLLRQMGAEDVDYLVPNRFEYGYGLSPEIVEVARSSSPDLIITVDNGIASISGVDSARAAGIDVLITDHHLPGETLPDANVIVNPNQPGDEFPSKSLAGVGVIFYTMLALRARLREQNWFQSQAIAEPNLADVLDIVALGTVADVVPLDRNNRILVQQGLRRIHAGRCCEGIRALIRVSGRDMSNLRSTDLGFAIAPRLNAAGRLQDMSVGIECLLADDSNKAISLAEELDDMNRERRAIGEEMQDEAKQMLVELHLDSDELPVAYCLYQAHWHQGIVGILAGRIKDQTHRPTIVFAQGEDGDLKGSARSIPGFHIRDALDAIASANPGLINRFGGHAMAAGLGLASDKLEAFSLAFTQYAAQVLSDEQLQGSILTDGELDANEMNLETGRLLEQAGPWGQGFPEPVFEGMFRVRERRRIGADQKHLKLTLEQNNNTYEAIAFACSEDDWPSSANEVKVAYRLAVNRYRGFENTQLMIEHVLL
ncbi:MAG: single-stranded-DNA-specific exonuclease RecJ [Gammaproteobacteria bacterium]|nr:MAG: single-stranded-DNA-specific exonuclease RecJ [Gammaproteobacteria bacterium]